MNEQRVPGHVQIASIAEELVERLARLEEQMRQVVRVVEKLSNRDTELETSLRQLSERFSQALDSQADTFRVALNELTTQFVRREDWIFWKNLLTAGLLSIAAYGWGSLLSGH